MSKVPDLVFAFEEALGYCIDPSHVPDKDGISAAMAIAKLASETNVAEFLNGIYAKYGHVYTSQVSLRFGSMAEATSAFERATAGMKNDDGMVIWEPSAGEKVIFRVSGTEPKLKCYLQSTGDIADLEQRLRKLLV